MGVASRLGVPCIRPGHEHWIKTEVIEYDAGVTFFKTLGAPALAVLRLARYV